MKTSKTFPIQPLSRLFRSQTLLAGTMLVCAASLGVAHATSLSIQQLMKPQVKALQVGHSWGTFTLSGKAFEVYFKSHYDNQKVNEMMFYFSDRNLTQTQVNTISRFATGLALKCYNLKPERQADIQSWMGQWLSENLPSQQVNFGPVLLDMQHTQDGRALVWFTRTGVPGKSPWINHCTA